MVTLAIDFGTKLGYAYGFEPGESGTRTFSSNRTERLVQFQEFLREMDSEAGPQRVIHERPTGRGNTIRCLAAYATLVELWGHACGLEVVEVSSTAVKKWATGNGRAEKSDMLAEARKRWPLVDIVNHDQADAMLMLARATEED